MILAREWELLVMSIEIGLLDILYNTLTYM